MTENTTPRRLLPVLLGLSLALAAVDLAEARRMGGGKSFGSRPSYSSPAPRPTSPGQNAPGQFQRNQAGPESQAGAPGAQARPASRFGGLGGMFGGLLMGGLLGSLLFGGGFAGPGLLDLLLVGGGLYLLFRFLRSRRQAAQYAGVGDRSVNAPEAGFEAAAQQPLRRTATGGDAWANLGTPGSSSHETAAPGPNVPEGFDQAEFLDGAKAVYGRLQDSWDRRDLADIRRFTEDAVYQEIERQAAEDPKPGKTDVLMVEARLLEVRTEDGQLTATVYYDALLREDQAAASPTQTREVWHFSRKADDPKAEWKLAGIQQLEE